MNSIQNCDSYRTRMSVRPALSGSILSRPDLKLLVGSLEGAVEVKWMEVAEDRVK
jgi:hypothetical protein